MDLDASQWLKGVKTQRKFVEGLIAKSQTTQADDCVAIFRQSSVT
jgi:hypothetical protein